MSQNADLTQQDRIDPARAEAWFATMGLEGSVDVGGVLPPFAHLAYFWQPVSNEALGLDGHAASGEAAPMSSFCLGLSALGLSFLSLSTSILGGAIPRTVLGFPSFVSGAWAAAGLPGVASALGARAIGTLAGLGLAALGWHGLGWPGMGG